MQMNEILLYFSLKYHGDCRKIYKALSNNETIDLMEYSKMKRDNSYKVTTIRDENYPDILKYIESPPILLFYSDDQELDISSTLIEKIIFEDGTRGFVFRNKYTNGNKEIETSTFACENKSIIVSLEKKMMFDEHLTNVYTANQ